MNGNAGFTTKNSILNALPAADLTRLIPFLERIELPLGKVLYQPDEPILHIYFPETAMISVVAYTEEGQGTEVAVIGGEGATGLSTIMGSESTPYENVVQMAGGGSRIKSNYISDEFYGGGGLQRLLLAFTHKLIVQISQTVLCNRIHSVEQRLSRWLLMCRDRSEEDSFYLTHEFLAVMLGSSRTAVTLTAIELQKTGLITYSRGTMTILDPKGLEAYTCTCYKVIADAYGLSK